MEGLTSSPVALWWEWVGLVAQLDIVGPWRLRGRREQRVGLLRAAPHAVGHPLVVHIDLFFADRPAEGPREVGQVVPDRIVGTVATNYPTPEKKDRGIYRDKPGCRFARAQADPGPVFGPERALPWVQQPAGTCPKSWRDGFAGDCPRLCCVLCAKPLEKEERSWQEVDCRSRPTHKGVQP